MADAAPLQQPQGKAGFAARIMSKYGWTKGSGLGAEGDGITTALRVQVEKRRRKADADGGGFAEPGGRGRIIAPKELKQKKTVGLEAEEGEEEGKFGKMSQVVVLRGMLEGMDDLRAEVEDGLGQEIGEECGEKYGRVERLFIDVDGRRVFIKFTDQVSALTAVNALEGRIFNGNLVVPRFYDVDRFERGEYS
jgi:splicing factor 45